MPHKMTSRSKWLPLNSIIRRPSPNLFPAIIRQAQASKNLRQSQFEARLQALSMAHDLLVSQNWRGASMHDLVEAEMAYCLDTSRRPCGRACANGPQIMLKPKAAQNIGLALHELAMNALAHGALARLDGCVTVIWSVDNERLIVEWRETGGPAVAAPPREGFGHMVVKRIVAQALGAKAIMSFPPNGFMWTLSVP